MATPLIKRLEKDLDENNSRILHTILNKSRMCNPIKQRLYDHLPPILQTIQGKRDMQGESWWSKDEPKGDVLLLTSKLEYSNNVHQFCADTGWRLQDFEKDELREKAGNQCYVHVFIYNIIIIIIIITICEFSHQL